MPPTRERRWWTSEEDDVLKNAVQEQSGKHGSVQSWNDIASSLVGRTNKDCRKRWSKIQADIQKGVWRQEEDERLQDAVQKVGFKWSRVANMVQYRNADQCAKRWQQVLRPDLNHTSWTPEEDQKLLEAIKTYDNNWKQISLTELPDRSTHDIRNRSRLLDRRSRNSDASRSRPTQSRTPSLKDREMALWRDQDADSKARDGGSERQNLGGRDMLVDQDIGVGSSTFGDFQHTQGSLSPHGSSGVLFDLQDNQGLPVLEHDWLSWGNPFDLSSTATTSASEFPWRENGPEYFPSLMLCTSGAFGAPGTADEVNSIGRTVNDIDMSIGVPDGNTGLESGQKGSVTLTLDQVDPNVAHEIMGSVLKHSAGLKIRCVVNGE